MSRDIAVVSADRPSGPVGLLSWSQIMDGPPVGPKTRLTGSRLTVLGVVLILLGALVLSLPLTITLATMPRADPVGSRADAGPDRTMLARAADYDRRLLSEGTASMGEAADPFNGTPDRPAWMDDRSYLAQLGSGRDMAVIRIPKIGVDLPVGHGTSPDVLEAGAGHIYGTTLPVGDPGNTVIAGHRGLGVRLLFYRLGELEPGDMIYTQAAGQTVAWKVDALRTVEPGSTAERRALDGDAKHTRLTLYTCDPPGLNTRRLLVAAHRVPYVDAVSVPGQTDYTTAFVAAGFTGLLAVTITLVATPKEPMVIRHAARR